MVLGNSKKLAFLAAMVGCFAASNALAADITDVLDAADEVYLGTEKVSDPFDISLTPKFVQRIEWAKLKREFTQDGVVHLGNELEYGRTVNEFDIDLEIGMFHDLAFRMHMPIIISDQQSYKFDTSSDKDKITAAGTQEIGPDGKPYLRGQSSLAPANPTGDTLQFFKLDDGQTLKGRKRTGIGDMSFGIAWSPYNTERHFIPERPWEHNTGRSTVTLAFDYVAPTGKVTKIDNDGVGSGVHEILLSVAASHRFAFVDPYIRLQAGFPIGMSDYYPKYDNQVRIDPGIWGRIDLGIEFIPYESIDVKFQRFVKIDLRGYFKYIGEGRAYSELSDALGQGDCYSIESLGDPKCAWVGSKWSNATSNATMSDIASGRYTGGFKEDGYFDYEGYATIGGALSLTVQPIQYVQISAGVAADYAQNHFITFTKTGKDRGTYDPETHTLDAQKKDGTVSLDSVDERNPTFSPALDAAGHRVKRTEAINLEWFIGVKLMY